MNIPSYRVSDLEDINQNVLDSLTNLNGPAVLEIALVDNNTPPMEMIVLNFYLLLENKRYRNNKKSYRISYMIFIL